MKCSKKNAGIRGEDRLPRVSQTNVLKTEKNVLREKTVFVFVWVSWVIEQRAGVGIEIVRQLLLLITSPPIPPTMPRCVVMVMTVVVVLVLT